MNRTYCTSRNCIGALLLAAVACESPSATSTERVPGDITLTAEEPVAAFEVRLCVTEDAPPEFEGDGSFSAQARVNEGSAELTLENLAVDPDYVGPAGSKGPVQVVTLSDSQSQVGVILTTRPDGLSAGECTETQVVQFSVGELASEQTVTIVSAEALFDGQWVNSPCGADLQDTSIQLEIERI